MCNWVDFGKMLIVLARHTCMKLGFSNICCFNYSKLMTIFTIDK